MSFTLTISRNMGKKIKIDSRCLYELEIDMLKQEIEILRQEKILERERTLKEVAQKLVERNMAFPVIRHTIDLLEEELRGIFYGSGRGE